MTLYARLRWFFGCSPYNFPYSVTCQLNGLLHRLSALISLLSKTALTFG